MSVALFRGKRSLWSHPSVIALMKDANPGEEPSDVIRRKARTLVDEALEWGWEGPPFDPAVLASFRGIEVVEVVEPIGSEARIFPTPEGAVRIEYDKSFPSTRVNFSICHELVHTFFPDCYDVARNRNHLSPDEQRHKELESLCDLGAAELLMPARVFRNDVIIEPVSLQRIVALAERYRASIEAVMIRATQFSEEPFAVVVLSEKFTLAEEREASTQPLGFIGKDVRPKLRVDYANMAGGFSVFIPKNKSAPPDSVAYKALTALGIHEAQECWSISGFETRRVQATVLPKVNGTNRVAVFIFQDVISRKETDAP